MNAIQAQINYLQSLLTVQLDDSNFFKWSYQLSSVLGGHDLYCFFDGTYPCPPKFVITTDEGDTTEITAAYKEWMTTDRALLGLLLATLSDEAMEYVLGAEHPEMLVFVWKDDTPRCLELVLCT